MSSNPGIFKSVDVTIIGGAGHVGLPLAITCAKEGLETLILDINERALATVAAGRMPHLEYDAEPLLAEVLASGRLHMTSRIEDLSEGGTVVITIGTPVDEFQNPVHKSVRSCVDSILPHIKDGQLIVLRSTVYPGTTEWLDQYLRDRGRTVKVAFCPERVVQGHAIRELREIPQIVSGTSPEAVIEAEALFGRFARHMVRMQPKEAELAKLFCNAVRYIQFAAANEFYMMADAAGLDYHRIHAGMTYKYPRAQHLSRPGFAAGPCLFKDTAQLAAFAGNGFSLGSAAIQVNEGLVLHAVDMMRKQYDLGRMTVGLLGMAFKPGVDDTRSSLSYKMKKILILHAREVLATDPYVTEDATLLPLDEVITRSDVLVLCTCHEQYRSLDFKGKPVVDVWGFYRSPAPP
ncbi:MAG: nucleotide sugar dehydrogenase [Alphaproteobacteria bacterium]|nr:nucleotide sugar dehydrogenase [Alphaproteobacteria bacterium]MBM3732140.1 nucleotide sugar dehydrogenase [Acidimicrobiia bacterium]